MKGGLRYLSRPLPCGKHRFYVDLVACRIAGGQAAPASCGTIIRSWRKSVSNVLTLDHLRTRLDRLCSDVGSRNHIEQSVERLLWVGEAAGAVLSVVDGDCP